MKKTDDAICELKDITQIDIYENKLIKKRKDLKHVYYLKIINQHLNV